MGHRRLLSIRIRYWALGPGSSLIWVPLSPGCVGGVGRLGGVESNHRTRFILEREYFPPATHYIGSSWPTPLRKKRKFMNFIIENEVPNFWCPFGVLGYPLVSVGITLCQLINPVLPEMPPLLYRQNHLHRRRSRIDRHDDAKRRYRSVQGQQKITGP